MDTARIAAQLGVRLTALCAVVAASAAFAQAPAPGMVNGAVPPGTTPAQIAADPGRPGPASVDPAPGAAGPYAGHSEHAFYDVDQRISTVQSRIASDLRGSDQKKAMGEIASIKGEEKEQIARHGDLLDWARENLNHRLDALVQAYPALQQTASAAGAAS